MSITMCLATFRAEATDSELNSFFLAFGMEEINIAQPEHLVWKRSTQPNQNIWYGRGQHSPTRTFGVEEVNTAQPEHLVWKRGNTAQPEHLIWKRSTQPNQNIWCRRGQHSPARTFGVEEVNTAQPELAESFFSVATMLDIWPHPHLLAETAAI